MSTKFEGYIWGIPVYVSDRVPLGEVWLYEWYPDNFTPIPATVLEAAEMQRRINSRTKQFFSQSAYHRTHYWHRLMGESITEWGYRLMECDYLDESDIRWEYQKAVIGSLVGVLILLCKRVVGKGGES